MSTSIELPWGKYKRATGETHRLEHHCADVAACFEVLVAQRVLRDRLARAADVEALDDVTLGRLSVLAFLHDFGKAASGFQFKVRGALRLVAPRPAGHLDASLQACAEERVATGLGLVELFDEWGSPGLDALFHAMLSHHGRPMNLGRVVQHSRNWNPFDGYDPVKACGHLFELARRWFPQAFKPGPPLPERGLFAHLFAGLLTLADQVGSNEELFKLDPQFDPDYIVRARESATKALCALGLARDDWTGPRGDIAFGTLFEGWKPHPMQKAVGEASLDSPVMIIESETGSGKTEAAIWRFAKLWRARRVDGLYFALPTRAAAEQLHRRVNQALARVFPAETRVQTILAVPGLIRAGEAVGWQAGWTVEWQDDPRDADRMARWSAESARKYLSATAAVGTVDQALLAGLQVKWAHLRGAALARSLLVVDEVHASDAYMMEILRQILRDHVDIGGHALLMSATLGSEARYRLLCSGNSAIRTTTLEAAENVPYPAVTLADFQNAPSWSPFRSTGHTREIVMSAVPALGDPARIARMALAAARLGGKVLVVRNTVDSARAVFDAVGAAGGEEELLWVEGGPALHHSRFAVEDRRLLDRAVERAVGKSREPGRAIVIGTQTLEQSLDIDADHLITDLCPVDVLLQRIGRLHRHATTQRPDALRDPRCDVLVPEGEVMSGGLLRHGMGMSPSGGIYRDLRALEMTKRLVISHPVWTIPKMNRMLVERGTHRDELRGLDAELESAWVMSNEVDGRAAAERVQARNVTLNRSEPPESGFCEVFGDDDYSVRTRLGEDGPTIRLVAEVDGPFGRPVTTFRVPAHMFRAGMPSREELENARAEVESDGVWIEVGAYRFRYDRGGIRRGS